MDSMHQGTGAMLISYQNKRIRRRTDKVILTILIWVYFLYV